MATKPLCSVTQREPSSSQHAKTSQYSCIWINLIFKSGGHSAENTSKHCQKSRRNHRVSLSPVNDKSFQFSTARDVTLEFRLELDPKSQQRRHDQNSLTCIRISIRSIYYGLSYVNVVISRKSLPSKKLTPQNGAFVATLPSLMHSRNVQKREIHRT